MSILSEIVDLVEADLQDATNAVWTSDEIEANIRRALYDYNRVAPQTSYLEVHTAADTLEYDLAAVTGLMEILQVCFPYEAADPVYPEAFIPWSRFLVGGVDFLRLKTRVEIVGDDTDNFRLRYTHGHTIEDLDSATATTLSAEGESIVILGATGFAATQVAQGTIGTVTATRMTPDQYRKWAASRHNAFQIALHNQRRRAGAGQDARTRPAQDRLL